jgi:uncharacterized protein
VRVISNATPIISLCSIYQVELLKKLFGKIMVPKAVYQEIKRKKRFGYKEIDTDFFEVREISGKIYLGFLTNELDQGEAESILLAKELQADILIIDERMGYRIAQSQGIFVIGTLTILAMAKTDGHIESVKPFMDTLIANGRWYSQRVYDSFLREMGEL